MNTAIKRLLLAVVVSATSMVSMTHAAMIPGDTADAMVLSTGAGDQGSGTVYILNVTSASLRAGRFDAGTPLNTVAVFVFELPSLGSVTNPFAEATLNFNLNTVQSSPPYDADLYGLDARALSTVITSDFYFGTADDPSGDATKLQDSILTPTASSGPVESVDIGGWLNSQYAGGANAGDFVFMRLSPAASSAIINNATNGYIVASADASSNQPFINFTLVPEPSTFALAAFGLLSLGIVVWRRRRR